MIFLAIFASQKNVSNNRRIQRKAKSGHAQADLRALENTEDEVNSLLKQLLLVPSDV